MYQGVDRHASPVHPCAPSPPPTPTCVDGHAGCGVPTPTVPRPAMPLLGARSPDPGGCLDMATQTPAVRRSRIGSAVASGRGLMRAFFAWGARSRRQEAILLELLGQL